MFWEVAGLEPAGNDRKIDDRKMGLWELLGGRTFNVQVFAKHWGFERAASAAPAQGGRAEAACAVAL
jgi:hypothetical protein